MDINERSRIFNLRPLTFDSLPVIIGHVIERIRKMKTHTKPNDSPRPVLMRMRVVGRTAGLLSVKGESICAKE